MKNKNKSENVDVVYRATVTIKEVDSVTGKIGKNILTHNEGKAPLFELIAKSIAGYADSVTPTPRFIKTYTEDNHSTLSSFVASNNPIVTKDVDSASVTLEFLLPFTQLSKTEATTKLRLYSSITDNIVYAEVDNVNFTGDGQTNYLVTWKMTISNK